MNKNTLRKLESFLSCKPIDKYYINRILIKNNTAYITDNKGSWITFPFVIQDGLYRALNGLLIKDMELNIDDDYPIVSESMTEGEKLRLNININQIKKSLGLNNSNKYLLFNDGIYIDNKRNKNYIVGTDGHNLYISKIKSNLPAKSFLFNCMFLRKFMNLFRIKETNEIILNDECITFVFDEIKITIFMEKYKTFPNYKSVIPKNITQHEVLFDIKYFKDFIKTPFGSKRCHDKTLFIKSENKEFVFYFILNYEKIILKMKTGIICMISDLPLIIYNTKSFKQIVKIMKEGELLFYHNDEPLYIKNDRDDIYLSMPVHGDDSTLYECIGNKDYQLIEFYMEDFID